jgi:16S rRNA (guanine527-N7)-methyltransferase
VTLAPPPPEADARFPDAVARLSRYADLLTGPATDWGLIGPREATRIWQRHLLNCAVAEAAFPADARVVDIGSGAGLPGIVLALVRPDLHVVLLESLQRRTDFLRLALGELDLANAEVVRGRAEDVPPLHCDAATARAVASLPVLAAWSARHLRPGGLLLAVKGAGAAAELAAAGPTLRRHGYVDGAVLELGAGVTDEPTRVVRLRYAGRAPVARRR